MNLSLADNVLIATKLFLALSGYSTFNPTLSQSTIWLGWKTNFGPFTCRYCAEQHGKIFDHNTPPPIEPPVHINCHCSLSALLSILAGTATIAGRTGVDVWLKKSSTLPDNYITKQEAEKLGWVSYLGNLRAVAPIATIGGNIHRNKEDKLPNAPGRIWYEVDINYTGGFRNTHRVVYSNDGLLFATYDHYNTFYEIR